MLTVFGFHTDDALYVKHAQILKESAKKFGIEVNFRCYAKNDWQSIIAFKPSFIAQMRRELQGKILYIDADAIILEDIRPFFENIQEDIAAHYIDNRLISSTLFINDTQGAHAVIDEWERVMQLQPERWDQVVFEEVIDEWVKDEKVTCYQLPPQYTFIFDTSRRVYGDSIRPSIEQLQASRDMRWIQKYRRRNPIYQWLMHFPFLLKSTRKVTRRHKVTNARAQQLGIDIRLELKDLIDGLNS